MPLWGDCCIPKPIYKKTSSQLELFDLNGLCEVLDLESATILCPRLHVATRFREQQYFSSYIRFVTMSTPGAAKRARCFAEIEDTIKGNITKAKRQVANNKKGALCRLKASRNCEIGTPEF